MNGDNTFDLQDLQVALANMPAGVIELDVYINSGGGLMDTGFAIFDCLRDLDIKVNTIVLGQCCSIATVIAQGTANGGLRKMYENSAYFIHNPNWTPNGPTPMEASDIEHLHEELLRAGEKLLDFYHTITGTKKSVLKDKMKEAKSLSADEAKSLGFIDEVILTTITNQKKYAIAAYINSKNYNNMNSIDFKKMFTDFENKITKMIGVVKQTVTNLVETTKDGIAVYFEGKLTKGTKVFADEAMTTALADAEYTFEKEIAMGADTIVVKDGMVDEVKLAVAAAAENKEAELQAKLDEQIAANQKLTDDLNIANTKITEVQNSATEAVEAVKTEFTNFKSNFFTGGELKPEFIQNFRQENPPADPNKKLSPIEVAAEMRKKRSATT